MSTTPPTGPPSSLATQGAATPFPSIAFAKAAGAVPGDVLSAPLAPATGPIAGAPESLVVVTLKHLKDSPTFKRLMLIIYSAWGVFAGYVGFQVLKNGSIFGLDWNAILRGGFDVAIVTALAGYGISLKKSDNNVTK